MREVFAAWVEEYSLPLLRWARGKTGDLTAAEDLAQEVWLQFFSAVRREADACGPSPSRSICCGRSPVMCG